MTYWLVNVGVQGSIIYIHVSCSGTIMNPTRPQVSISQSQASLARRWQHFYPHSKYKYDFNWKSLVTPGRLPLTVEHMPSSAELDSSFDVFSYEFIVDPSEMRSFLVKLPILQGSAEDLRRAWAYPSYTSTLPPAAE